MKEGPQPPACVVDSCERPPANGMVGYCTAHQDHYANGSATTPPIIQPDDPALLEREAKRAAKAEAAEYAERRRVKTWKTLENGSRVPEEYWTDDELEAIEAEAAEMAGNLKVRTQGGVVSVTRELLREAELLRTPAPPAPDPEKVALKTLKRALRGKYGQGAQLAIQGLVDMLEGP